MPITTSAKKALRNSRRKRDFNMARKTTLTSTIKKFRKLVTAGKIDEAKKMMPEVSQAIDKAAKTNLIKDNNAGRKKSRLAALLKKGSSK
jgi:small subunit ribosomal protein S20